MAGDQGVPPQGAQPQPAPGGDQGSGEKGSVTDLVAGIEAGMVQLQGIMTTSGQVPPEIADELGQVIEGYRSVMTKAIEATKSGGQMPQQPAPGGQGAVTPEQGGNPGAVPMQQ